MSKLTKLIAIIAATAGIAGGVITSVNPVSASAATKFRYYKNIKDRTYKVTNKKAVIYSNGKIKHKTGAKLGEYGKYVTGYYASHVTINGKKSVYYKFKTGSGHTGWVWHGYLKKTSSKANKVTISTSSNSNWDESDYDRLSKGKKFKMNLADYRKGFLDTVNKERAKRGISALKEDSGLNGVAMKRDLESNIDGSHYTSDGQIAFKVESEVAGIKYARAENIGMKGIGDISHGLNSDDSVNAHAKFNIVTNTPYNAAKAEVLTYIYDDADEDWGHRDNLLNPAYNVIGIGAHNISGNSVVSDANILGTK